MEKSKNKTRKRLGEILILAMVLVSAALAMTDMAVNVIEELDFQESQAVVEEEQPTSTPSPAVRPTRPADYTPESFFDA